MNAYEEGSAKDGRLNEPRIREAIAEAAKARAYHDALTESFRSYSPLDIIAIFSSYGLVVNIQKTGTVTKPFPQLSRHHCELLQAILLTIPVTEWGADVELNGVMESISDAITKLSDTFVHERYIESAKQDSVTDGDVQLLQQIMRLKTHSIGSGAHLGEIKDISMNLYQVLDSRFANYFGFGCSDLIKLMSLIVDEHGRRISNHFDIVNRVMQGKTPLQTLELYLKNVPDVGGTINDYKEIVSRFSLTGIKSLLWSHFDLRLKEEIAFHPDTLAKLSGFDPEKIRAMLAAISLSPGDLASAKREHFFLSNPIWGHPAIECGSAFVMPTPLTFFSHIHQIMDRLASEADAKDALDKARNVYLESNLATCLRGAFPKAEVVEGAKWNIGDVLYETDALVLFDRLVLIAEAKANRVTPEGQRGAPARMKKHVQEIILDPSIQSQRLADLIEEAKRGDDNADTELRSIGIDASKVDKVIRISITIDDVSIISSFVEDIKNCGWIPKDHMLAPTISLSDLRYVVDILENPIVILHYLEERMFLQNELRVVGDETDYLGLYLKTGFNLLPGHKRQLLTADSMGDGIERYYNCRDAGITIAKPRVKMAPYIQELIAHLSISENSESLIAGMHVLGALSPPEQKHLEKMLARACKTMRRSHNIERQPIFVPVPAPLPRKSQLGFCVFHEHDQSDKLDSIRAIGGQLHDSDSQGLITMFSCTAKRTKAYEDFCIFGG